MVLQLTRVKCAVVLPRHVRPSTRSCRKKKHEAVKNTQCGQNYGCFTFVTFYNEATQEVTLSFSLFVYSFVRASVRPLFS